MGKVTDHKHFSNTQSIVYIIILLIIFILAGIFFFAYKIRELKDTKGKELQTLSELKEGQLTQWQKERLSEAVFFSANEILSGLIEDISEERNNGLNLKITDFITPIMSDWRYENISVHDTTGGILYSFKKDFHDPEPEVFANIAGALKKHNIFLSGFYYCTLHNVQHYDIISPVRDKNGTVIAEILFRIDPEVYLIPLIRSWPVYSRTSETILIQKSERNILIVNNPRFNTSNNETIKNSLVTKDMTILKALEGFTGEYNGKDYRGKRVYAYIEKIPGTSWYIISKVDKTEMVADLFYDSALIMVIIMLALFLAWTLFSMRGNVREMKILKSQREVEERYRSFFETSMDAILLTSPDGKIHGANTSACQMFGYSELEIIKVGRNGLVDISHPSLPVLLNERDRSGKARGELILIRSNGEKFPAEITSSIFTDASGQEMSTMIIRDISKRKASEKALVESEERFNKAFKNSPDAIILSRVRDGIIIEVNDSFERISGWSASEVIGNSSVMMNLWADTVDRDRYVAELKEKGRVQDFITSFRTRSGEIRDFVISGEIFNLREEPHILGIIRDVTEKKKIEESLRNSQEQLLLLIEYAPISVAMLDNNLRYIITSRQWIKCYGKGLTDLTGKHHYEINPDLPETWKEVHKRGLDGEYNEKQDDLWIKPDGTREWSSWAVMPWRNMKGEIGGIIISAEDVTKRKENEEEIVKLNSDLEQRVLDRTDQLTAANKELESFSYSVSHDLRAPLRGIDGFTRILLEEYSDKLDDEGKRICSVISENTLKMATLIDDLLSFSKLNRKEILKTKIDMSNMVNSIYHEVTTPEMRKKIKFEVDGLPDSSGDTGLLRQVWANLISNAVKFSSKQDKPEIKITGYNKDHKIIYRVSDNGAGFNMKYINKLFGVFQRLHSTSEFEGTGVGLAIVQRIIHRHGGEVWAEGEVGKGAVFYFSLPEV